MAIKYSKLCVFRIPNLYHTINVKYIPLFLAISLQRLASTLWCDSLTCLAVIQYMPTSSPRGEYSLQYIMSTSGEFSELMRSHNHNMVIKPFSASQKYRLPVESHFCTTYYDFGSLLVSYYGQDIFKWTLIIRYLT